MKRDANRLLAELKKRPKMFETLMAMIRETAVSLHDVLTFRKTKTVARVRRHFWLWIRDEYDWSYPEIGNFFGCSWTTVMIGIKRAREEMESDENSMHV